MTAHQNAKALSTAASSEAMVEIVEANDLTELDSLRATMTAIWGEEVVPPRNVLKAISLAGSCMLLARRGDANVGFALGIVGWEGGVHFHSHQVGVVEGARGSGVGYALKLAQRAVCLSHGITEMRWTFDPLLAGNARFNLLRLGAIVSRFIPNCYGSRIDRFNTGDVTDRLEVIWDLGHDVSDIQPIRNLPNRTLVTTLPTVSRNSVTAESGTTIPLPEDYLALKSANRAEADAWRLAVGRALMDTMDAHLSIVGMNSDGFVVGDPLLSEYRA